MTSVEHPKLMQAIGLGADLAIWQGYRLYDHEFGYDFGRTPVLTISTVITLKVIMFNRFNRGSLAFYQLSRLLLAPPGHGLGSGH